VPGARTEVTEIATGLGMLAPDLDAAVACRPERLRNVSDDVWDRVVAAYRSGHHDASFSTAFANGVAFLWASDGLRLRPPLAVEWKGPHRPPGDDVVPADLRIDHVFSVSCKYLSRILHNPGPARLFDRCLVGEERAGLDWFGEVAPDAYQALYDAVRADVGPGLPARVTDLGAPDRAVLKEALRFRKLPSPAAERWAELCASVSSASAARWQTHLGDLRRDLRLLWRLLRIGDAPYFVLGTDDRGGSLRLRVASTWDWVQASELRAFTVSARPAGQPEVVWRAVVRDRCTAVETEVQGHVEVRWSHGRFSGCPEAKVYLDTPLADVPGYVPLV
jgi:hypothetical protein